MCRLLQTVALGAMLLLSDLSIGAPKDFCQTYAQNAVKQYWMMKEDPSYECYPDKEYMPLWSPDPRDHYNWCTHKAVSPYKAGRELERRERFLVEACQYDLHYAEIPDPNPPQVKVRKVKKSLFHKRGKARSVTKAPCPPTSLLQEEYRE